MSQTRQTKKKPGSRLKQLLVRTAPGNRSQGILQAGPLRIRTALGRSGTTSRKREGDGATPIGSMRLLYGYRKGRGTGTARTTLPVSEMRADMLWCDASRHPAYNRPVRAPFSASHEQLLRADELYDLVIVMDWNIRMRKRGCGSAIFFHIARTGYTPTEGCVAIRPRDMQRLLPYLGTDTRLQVL
ncbi:L,D-transpeptidase [Rhizobium sp. AAP43]|uniref:L,D-transpeptidase family protein n=1 Tax=Rhizobium sp. AAP43 TaxID=1523420 RepID=UPI000AB57858|nr:L,D-transpeptidase family protein [Rhizobium sp. AAP43]